MPTRRQAHDLPPRLSNALLALVAAGLAGIVGTSTGCYERVVKAKGFGAQGVDVAKPNLARPSDSDEWGSSSGSSSINWPKGKTKP